MREGGLTLIELVIVLAVIGVLSVVVVPRAADWLDRLAVERATSEVMTFAHRARFTAIFRARTIRLEFTRDSLLGILEGWPEDTVLAWAGPGRHGVTLRVSRAKVRYYPNGLGRGGANTKIVIRRGMVAESLTTSRLGRLKRW